MTPERKVTPLDPDRGPAPPAAAAGTGGDRPLTARSVVASTLLGVRPPRLTTRVLVRSGALFGIAEGTTRTALSRMVAAGELTADGGGYRLAGHLLGRQARQDLSRAGPPPTPWDRTWDMAVVTGDQRPAEARNRLRRAAGALRLAELREGTWLRPANLAGGILAEAEATVDAQCRRFTARPTNDPADLAAELWDLTGWAARARELAAELETTEAGLVAGELAALPDAFVRSAAVLRHLQADPLLPDELVPRDWPGGELRATYDRWDRAFAGLWRAWYRDQVRDGAG